jgi:hypothetical protein
MTRGVKAVTGLTPQQWRCKWIQDAPKALVVTRALKPSLKYGTLCLPNLLSGDPYYLKYHQRE